MKKILNNSGVTFIELLLYISIFLVIVPLLLTISVNAVQLDKRHNIEKQINIDSQFMIERIFNLITSTKKIDMAQLLKIGIKNLKNASAGGHIPAAGATIQSKDINQFKRNIKNNKLFK